jgi:hypothetical protein
MPYQNYINKDHNKSTCAAQQAGKFKENNKKKSEKKENKGLLKTLIIGPEIANRAPT